MEMDLRNQTLDILISFLQTSSIKLMKRVSSIVHTLASNTSSSGVTPQYHLLNMLRGFIVAAIACWVDLSILNAIDEKCEPVENLCCICTR